MALVGQIETLTQIVFSLFTVLNQAITTSLDVVQFEDIFILTTITIPLNILKIPFLAVFLIADTEVYI